MSANGSAKLAPAADDDELDMERANLLTEEKGAASPGRGPLPDIPLCGCLSLQFYQPYFDVDTKDVIDRASQAVFYCRREHSFIALVGDRPDAYGPVWIATSLVFALSIAAHLHGFFSAWLRGKTWEYDFQSILTASSLVYGYLFAAAGISWVAMRQFDANVRFSSFFCLFGYANLVYIPAVLICLVPSEIGAWAALLVACCVSTIFVLRNLGPYFVESKQVNLIAAAVGIMQLVYVLFLKFQFFYEKG